MTTSFIINILAQKKKITPIFPLRVTLPVKFLLSKKRIE